VRTNLSEYKVPFVRTIEAQGGASRRLEIVVERETQARARFANPSRLGAMVDALIAERAWDGPAWSLSQRPQSEPKNTELLKLQSHLQYMRGTQEPQCPRSRIDRGYLYGLNNEVTYSLLASRKLTYPSTPLQTATAVNLNK
jgi:hypothetical protein